MKSKTVAALLAFFLGGFGVHRFYLGQFGLGVVYLLFSLTFIPALIAIIDCIAFLTMSEWRFDRKYNSQYVGHQPPPGNIVINNNVGTQAAPAPDYVTSQAAGSQWDAVPEKDPFELEGDRLVQQYEFDAAIKQYKKSLQVNSRNPTSHFRLACLYSLMEKVDTSLFHLHKAMENGYSDIDTIHTHDYLSHLRAQQAFLDFKNNGYQLGGPSQSDTDRLDLSDTLLTQLERLAKLRDEGIITDTDFDLQKKKLLR